MCLPVAGQLPASKSHAARRWTFQPTRDLSQPALGTVSIVQGKSEVKSYSIDVESIGCECHQILFAKLDDAADVYGVAVNPSGTPVTCTCFGFATKRTCKHLDVAKELIADDIVHLAKPEVVAVAPAAKAGWVAGFSRAEASF